MSKLKNLITEYRNVFSKAKPTYEGEIINITECKEESFIEITKSVECISIYAGIDYAGYDFEGEIEYFTTIKGKYLNGNQNAEMSMSFRNIDPSDLMEIIDQFRDQFVGIVNFRNNLEQ